MKINNSKYPLTLQKSTKIEKKPVSNSVYKIKSKRLLSSQILAGHFHKPISKIIDFDETN